MKVLRITLTLSALMLLFVSSGVAGSATQNVTDTMIEEALPHQAPVQEPNTKMSGPAYVNHAPSIPWGGLIAIPALALVFMFPVIVVKYFPGMIPHAASQAIQAQP